MGPTVSSKVLRVLLVEDEPLVASEITRTLEDAGCEIVGPIGGQSGALTIAQSEAIDGAIIDANLRGDTAEPVADVLVRRGIPFLVISGSAPPEEPNVMGGHPFLAKPFGERDLVSATLALFPADRVASDDAPA
jgi:CheY-like chemotaxis protein